MPGFSVASRLHQYAPQLAEKILPLFIIALHFSPAVTLVLLISILLCWLAYKPIQAVNAIKHYSFIRYSTLLFLVLAISMLYSEAPLPQATATLIKYSELLFPLLFIPFINQPKTQILCQKALLIALFTGLFFAYLNYVNLHYGHWLPDSITKHLIKSRITHSIFMAFLAFYCLHRCYQFKPYRFCWVIAFSLIVFDLFILCDGRTGQLIFILLCALFFLQVYQPRTAVTAIVSITVLYGLFLFYSVHADRIFEGVHESMQFLENTPGTTETSMGLRLHFWQDSLTIIQHYPIFGTGVGGLAFAAQNLLPDSVLQANAHNEYIMLFAQTGIVGFLVFLAFLNAIRMQLILLPKPQSWLLQGLLVSFLTSCLFNSSLLDHTEGHWFMTLITLYAFPFKQEQHA
jgi:O-antigen ligase